MKTKDIINQLNEIIDLMIEQGKDKTIEYKRLTRLHYLLTHNE
jgi:hypothetical protein